MVTTEIWNSNAAVMEANVPELGIKVAEQVSEILKEAAEWKKIPRLTLAYRVPAPGVRYYF